jgi:hypothetical protein
LRLQVRPDFVPNPTPGTEFLDAETGPQISPPKWVSAHRDKNPGNEWSEIPAETPYLALCRKHAVCERLRDPPTEWSRQFEALGLNPE